MCDSTFSKYLWKIPWRIYSPLFRRCESYSPIQIRWIIYHRLMCVAFFLLSLHRIAPPKLNCGVSSKGLYRNNSRKHVMCILMIRLKAPKNKVQSSPRIGKRKTITEELDLFLSFVHFQICDFPIFFALFHRKLKA